MKGRYITLTWELIRDKGTTMQEKLILMEISQLTSLDKGCVASNKHFAQLLGIKNESVSRSINSLEKKGFIVTKIKNGTRNYGRTITLNKLLSTLNKLLFDPKQIVIPPLTNCLETKENITVNITESNSAHKFLMNNYPSRWEVWEMQNKKMIENYDKFLLDYDDKVTIEKLDFELNTLIARISTYARNWIANAKQSKVINLKQELSPNHPSLKILKYK